MTNNISVFGQPEVKEEKVLRPIEIIKFINSFGDLVAIADTLSPNAYDNLVLLCKNYSEPDLDLILCYDDLNKPNMVVICLGHWNDGVV